MDDSTIRTADFSDRPAHVLTEVVAEMRGFLGEFKDLVESQKASTRRAEEDHAKLLEEIRNYYESESPPGLLMKMLAANRKINMSSELAYERVVQAMEDRLPARMEKLIEKAVEKVLTEKLG